MSFRSQFPVSSYTISLVSGALILAVAASFAGCAAQDKSAPTAGDSAPESVSLERSTSDDEAEEETIASKEAKKQRARTQAGLEDLVAGNTTFAFDLHKALSAKKNQIYSPYSISRAVAPLRAGAAGQTATEIDQVLRFQIKEGNLHEKFGRLGAELDRREHRDDKAQRGFRLKISNDIWSAPDLAYQTGFLKIIENNYFSAPQPLDFTAPEKSRLFINNHVKEATAGKITELLPDGSLTKDTRLVVTNAVYFNAPWAIPFSVNATQDGTFKPESGNEVNVPMMSMTDTFQYLETADYQLLKIPYAGNEVAAYVLLPKSGSYDSVDRSLSEGRFKWMREQVRTQRVQLKLPRFKIRSTLDLKKTLNSMGLQSMFDAKTADFSAMATAKESLVVSDVLHQGFISVDEAGTEAAAATAGIMRPTGMAISEPKNFHANRPFTFLIVDEPTGSLLFAARVHNPAL